MSVENGDMVTVFKGKHVLITGGLGFIGSNLAIRLVELGAEVVLVDSLIPQHGGNWFNIKPIEGRVRVNVSDVRDKDGFGRVVQGQDFLFNLAGQSSHTDSMRDPEVDLSLNCLAQLRILEACRDYNPNIRIVFTSTRQIYGKPRYLPVNEEHILQPIDINGVDKMAGESYHVIYNNVYGIRVCVLRLTNTIGPRMRIKDARQNFVGLWVKLLLQGKPLEVWGGEQLRDFSYVDDVIDACLLTGASDNAYGQVYNLGSSDVTSLKDLAERMIRLNGKGVYTIRDYPAERKRIDIGDYFADYSRIQEELGWRPRVDLEQALRQTLTYYRSYIDRYL